MLAFSRRSRHTLQLILGLGILLALQAAWADTEPRLRIEDAPGAPGQHLPLSHPVELSSSELATLLASLEFSEGGLLGRSSRSAVFGSDEAQTLASELVAALARASAAQQVRFASFNRGSGTIGQLRKTEGVVFVDRERQLNIAFTGIQEFAGPDSDFFAFLELTQRNPLNIERSLVRLRSERASQQGVALELIDGRPLWVRIGLNSLAAISTTGSSAVESVPAAAAERAAPSPATITGTPAAVAPITPSAQPDSGVQAEIRQRLEFLKSLHEDGLITAEEYEQQRREALRRLQ